MEKKNREGKKKSIGLCQLGGEVEKKKKWNRGQPVGNESHGVSRVVF